MHLKVITPLGIIIDRDIEELQIKSSVGWLAILPGHADLVTPLRPAVAHLKTKLHVYDLVLTKGVMTIDHKNDAILIVADALFYKNQIDYKVASDLLENARRRLNEVKNRREKRDILLVIAEQEAKIALLDLPGRKRI